MKSDKPRTPAAAAPPSPAARLLRSLAIGTCVRYTAIAFCEFLITYILYGEAQGPAVLHILLLLPYSLCLTGATCLRRTDAPPLWVRVILHPLFCIGGFLLFVCLPVGVTGGNLLVGLLLASLIYGSATALLLVLGRKSKQRKNDSTPYQSQFGNR